MRTADLTTRTRRRLAALVLGAAAAAAVPALAAGPVYWSWPDDLRLEGLRMDGVAVDVHGRLMPGLASEETVDLDADVVWELAAGDGALLAATGSGGRLWRLRPGKEAEILATLPEPELFAVLPAADGRVFVGGGPDGLLFRVSADGEAETWADLPLSYVWDVAMGPHGRLFLAAGSPAAVYRVDERLAVEKLADLPAANALCLAVDGQGRLLVGTQGPGLIYRLDPDSPGSLQALAETAQDEVRRLVPGPDGAWYALALADPGKSGPEQSVPGPPAPGNGQGRGAEDHRQAAAIHRIDPDGLVTLLWSGDRRPAAIVHDARLGWLAAAEAAGEGGGAALLALDPPRGARELATWEAGQATALLGRDGGRDGGVVVGLSHPARVLRLGDGPAVAGTATSEPVDAGMPVRWGRLRWEGEAPRGAELRWSARGGPRSQPDETWTGWSGEWTETDHALDLPPLRFLQWRVVFAGEVTGARVAGVTVSAREPNRAPRIESFTVLPEGRLERGGLMSPQENVTESLPGGLRVEYSLASRPDRRVGAIEAAQVRPVRTFRWEASDPNGDRLVYRLEYQRPGESSWRPIGDWTDEQAASWNTAVVPDGAYVVRLLASDDPDNALGDALRDERLLPALTVDHGAPRIEDFSLAPAEDGFRLRFRASDATSPIGGAVVELPDGRQEPLDPVDGIADSLVERYDRQVRYPAPDRPAAPPPWRIRVVVSDRPGNAAVAEGEVGRGERDE